MPGQLVVESPDFDRIRKDAGSAAEDAIRLLWFVLNDEISLRRSTVRQARETLAGKTLSRAPTAQQNDFDTEGALVVYFTGATAFTITGIRNGVEGRTIVFQNIGSGTVTWAHNSTGSILANRLWLSSLGNETQAQDATKVFSYINALWREWSL